MKATRRLLVIGMVCIASAATVGAAVVGGVNWADSVYDYTSYIQNYGGTLMTASTEFWVTGPSDADADGNGYAWDAGDPDNVAGWRTINTDQYIVMQWQIGVADVPGDDLTIRMYGGPSASANVLASEDGTNYTHVGTIGGGTPGYFRDETFDFTGLFSSDVHYVKVLRVASGPQTGMFFDSFAGGVPEPTTLVLLTGGAAALLRRRSHR